jgi:hypothetical protein
MSDLTAVVIFIGGNAILLMALLQWRQLIHMRRDNAESARRHELFQQRMRESADLPVDKRKEFYEEALSDLRAPLAETEKLSNRELREENARLRAELSSRR